MGEHKALKIILCIIAVVFVAHQIYSSTYKPITTVSAEFQTVTEGIDISGFVVRNEKIITSDVSGSLHFVVADGERVAKGGTIANIYSSAESSDIINRIEQINSRKADIEAMQSYNDVDAANLTIANTKITNSLNELIRSCAANKFLGYEEYSEELLTNISRKQMITGEQTDFSELLTQLDQELQTLNASLPEVKSTVVSRDSSGYFISSIDGYENILSDTELDKITPDYIENLKPQETPDNTIGKIVMSYDWYIAAVMSIEDSMQYKQGDTLTLKTALKSSEELNVTVESINISSDSDRAVMIFSCSQMNSELASMRRGNMTIIKNVYEGLKLPAKALRVKDGKTGVFVRHGQSLKFVTVEVLYRNDEYIICEQQISNDESVLRLYDDVVVKGKRLYDGKIVD